MSVCGSFAGPIHATCAHKTPKTFRLVDSNKLRFTPRNIYGSKVGLSVSKFKCCASMGMNRPESRFNKSHSEPFWVTFSKEAIWGLRSLVMFLVEQPGQLKYIEWPSFQSTLKTATLTLVLVVMLIVALSSVDSILCYLLALMLRKSA